jgi:hypothetical protein
VTLRFALGQYCPRNDRSAIRDRLEVTCGHIGSRQMYKYLMLLHPVGLRCLGIVRGWRNERRCLEARGKMRDACDKEPGGDQ